MTMLTPTFLWLLVTQTSLSQTPTGSPTVTILADETLTVYYSETRQMLIYKKLAELSSQGSDDIDISLAETELQTATLTDRGYDAAKKKLDAARERKQKRMMQQALERAEKGAAPYQGYQCYVRYEIPMTPTLEIKALPCR